MKKYISKWIDFKIDQGVESIKETDVMKYLVDGLYIAIKNENISGIIIENPIIPLILFLISRNYKPFVESGVYIYDYCYNKTNFKIKYATRNKKDAVKFTKLYNELNNSNETLNTLFTIDNEVKK